MSCRYLQGQISLAIPLRGWAVDQHITDDRVRQPSNNFSRGLKMPYVSYALFCQVALNRLLDYRSQRIASLIRIISASVLLHTS